MAKSDYYDDPESYWEEKISRKIERGRERLEQWEKDNPHLPYGHSLPQPKEDQE